MKKGFTLAEVMGVIVIMAALALVIVPVVDKQLKEGKEQIYNDTISSIKSSLDLYMNDITLDNNESMIITLYQLKQSGLIDTDIKNPITSKLLANDMLLTILNDNGVLKYNIDDEVGTNKEDYSILPKMTLNGDTLMYVELGDTYTEQGVNVSYEDMDISYNIQSNVNTNEVGIYHVIYTVDIDNVTNKVIRTVIVKDTKGPTVLFDTLNIPLSSVNAYDFKSDINTYDLSGVKSIEIESNFGALTGTYSVKYIVKDNYDNVTVKYRKVITS